MNKPYVRLDRDNAAVLLVDHQAGLLSLVRDVDPDKFKNNVMALADAAEFCNVVSKSDFFSCAKSSSFHTVAANGHITPTSFV